MNDLEGGKHIGIIILAAGGSSRMGTSKQLLIHRDSKTLIRHIVELATKTALRPVVVVLGANNELIQNELTGLNVRLAINDQWTSGISSSIKLGLTETLNVQPTLDAVLFLVCDQPFVNASLIENIVAKYIKTGKQVIACHYKNSRGTPALFDRSFFNLLLLLKGDKGARQIIHQFPEQIGLVNFEDGLFDIDTEEDYKLYAGK